MAEQTQRVDRALIISTDDPFKGGGVGGKHTHIRLLAKGLRALGVRAEIAAVREGLGFQVLRRYPGAVVRRFLRSRDERYEHYLMQYVRELERTLKRSSVDFPVTNPHDVVASSCLWGKAEGGGRAAPTVLTLHGYFANEMVSAGQLTRDSPQFRKFMDLERSAYERAQRIVCVDSRIRDYVLSAAPSAAERIAVIPNAVDVEAFSPMDPFKIPEARKMLGIAPEAKIVLCPRRLVPKNGVAVAVRAMPSLVRRERSALLVIAGDGPQRPEVERLVRDLNIGGSVRLLGSVPHDDLVPFYRVADAVAIPSVTSAGVEEATSLAMLEGMACGRPVVVTDVGGLREVVRDGCNGIVVPQNNPEALADALFSALTDEALAEMIASRALEYVRQNHSHMAHAKRVLAEYERAAAAAK